MVVVVVVYGATQKDWVVKKKTVPAKRYAGGAGKKVCRGGPGGFPPRQKEGRNLTVLAAAVS